MRVNVYAEELTDRIEIVEKEIDGTIFTGLRIYLELPVTIPGARVVASNHAVARGRQLAESVFGEVTQIAGPFMHRHDDDDSSAVTFWGKRDLRGALRKALALLDEHYGQAE